MNDPFFGIGRLDDELNGIPDKKTVLISASPSIGNEVFGYQILYDNIKNGKKVSLFLNRTSPESYLTDMKEYDFTGGDKVDIIDSYSGINGVQAKDSARIHSISNPYDKEEVKKTILAELDKKYDLFCRGFSIADGGFLRF
jgi:RecA-superfamily ATPases implicated in signal transduction